MIQWEEDIFLKQEMKCTITRKGDKQWVAT